MVVHIYNPSTQEAGAGRLQAPGQTTHPNVYTQSISALIYWVILPYDEAFTTYKSSSI
jgi:hypothetical protein